MKILQVVHRFPPERVAGTELYTLAISRALLDRGHRCHVLAGTDKGGEGGALTSGFEDGIHVTRVAGSSRRVGWWFPSYDPEIEDRVRGYLSDLKPDVVHIQHWVSLTANLISLCCELGCPTVVTLWDLAVICPRGDRLRFDRVFCTDPLSEAPCLTCVQREPWQADREVQAELALRQEMVEQGLHLADRLVVPSQAQKEFLARLLDVGVDRLEVLPHGTLHDLQGTPSLAGPPRRRPLRVGHWGHLMWQKGPHLLLEAVRKLSDPGAVEVHLIGEAGDPTYREDLAALARDISVTFHGPFAPKDLEGLDLDVAVFPSLCHESHSFVLDEAFQLGLPVIVSDRGAPAERVGAAGLVFVAGEVDDLAAKLAHLLVEPGALEQMRRATPKDPPHRMSDHALALERIYEEVIRSRRERSVPRPDYLRILVLKQRQLAARQAAIRQEQLRSQELQTRSREYQAHLEHDLEQAKVAYQQLLAEARVYQGKLERDLETAKAAYQQVLSEAREYQDQLERALEDAKAAYQQLLADARAYQGKLERDLEQAQAQAAQLERDLEQVQAQAAQLERDLEQVQAQAAQLERQIENLSQERDLLKRSLETILRHPAITFYLRAWQVLTGKPEGR